MALIGSLSPPPPLLRLGFSPHAAATTHAKPRRYVNGTALAILGVPCMGKGRVTARDGRHATEVAVASVHVAPSRTAYRPLSLAFGSIKDRH
jgi:hypothetical protein